MAEQLETTAFDQPANIGLQSIAAAYAKALFAAAESAGVLDQIVGELEGLLDQVIAKYPKLIDVLVSGQFSSDQKVGMIDRALAGKVHRLLLNFLKVLAEHDRAYIV